MRAFSIHTELLEWQQAAVRKLMPLRVGALFMESGTGRIRTALELIRCRVERVSRVIWFCPTALKTTIQQEITGHCGSFPREIHLIGIESMSASIKSIQMAEKYIDEDAYVIVDESHYIKGYHAKRSGRIIDMARFARFRLILSANPITLGVQDLFTQMLFLSEKILGYQSFYAFAANHLEYTPTQPPRILRAHNLAYLAAKIEPYSYQLKRSGSTPLPSALYARHFFKMSREQRLHYEQQKRFLLQLEDFSNHTLCVLFVRLQQILSGFRVHGDGTLRTLRNTRLESLKQYLELQPGSPVCVIWAKFQYDLEAIASLLPAEETVVLSPRTAPDVREAQLREFGRSVRFLIANIRLSRHDLNLNAADAVIFYNSGFSYADRLRAEERSRQPGQSKRILYVDLVCMDSIDHRIQKSLVSKEHLVRNFRREVADMQDMKLQKKLLQAL